MTREQLRLKDTQRISASSDGSVRTVAVPLNANQEALAELQQRHLELWKEVGELRDELRRHVQARGVVH